MNAKSEKTSLPTVMDPPSTSSCKVHWLVEAHPLVTTAASAQRANDESVMDTATM